MYHMNITIRSTLCTKSDAVTDLEDCKFNPKEKVLAHVYVLVVLLVVIWEPIDPFTDDVTVCLHVRFGMLGTSDSELCAP